MMADALISTDRDVAKRVVSTVASDEVYDIHADVYRTSIWVVVVVRMTHILCPADGDIADLVVITVANNNSGNVDANVDAIAGCTAVVMNSWNICRAMEFGAKRIH